MRKLTAYCVLLLLALSCGKPEPRMPVPSGNDTPEPEDTVETRDTSGRTGPPVIPEDNDKYGVGYIFDGSVIPEVHLDVPLDQWNGLLDAYDACEYTTRYVSCDIRYVKGDEETVLKGIGLRLRGNSTRSRPETGAGPHEPGRASRCQFGLNFDYFTEGEDMRIHNSRGFRLKAFRGDPSCVREKFCYDVMRDAGIWTAVHSEYCRLWIRVGDDPEETYYGVYLIEESVNKTYLKQRKAEFADAKGNLWKCRFHSNLDYTRLGPVGVDRGDDMRYVYEYKMDEDDFPGARRQFVNFLSGLQKEGKEFHDWMLKVCDVNLLLRTFAASVALGMWDDCWHNANNYYLYFNSRDEADYKLFFIPYDYDISLGTTAADFDAVRCNPYEWGENIFISKLLEFEDFRETYSLALVELCRPGGLLDESVCRERISGMQDRIRDFLFNDTGESIVAEDLPADFSGNPEYRLLEDSDNNFFRIKSSVVNSLCTPWFMKWQ